MSQSFSRRSCDAAGNLARPLDAAALGVAGFRGTNRVGSNMISRHWRGLAKPPHADDYVRHLRSDTFPELSKIPGFIDASILRRNVQGGVEFLIVTNWESMRAIEQFAGRDSEVAVVPEKVQHMMLEYDRRARHYEVLA
jgi:heme-degrading monooxygenase HmoA